MPGIAMGSAVTPRAIAASELMGPVPPWLEGDVEQPRGRTLRPPEGSEIPLRSTSS